MAASNSIHIYHYRGDNGQFADDKFQLACSVSHQTFDYCGMEAYFQNGITESNIGFL